ncbi:MAG: DUF2167 domain-containing protein [Acidobacteria bacterium]|nr:DUF2167 domain-containing protein [Acidobacteriota bacterium]
MFLRNAIRLSLICCLLVAASAAPARSQGQIAWQDGPTLGKLGNIAEIKIPEGFKFAGKEGAKQFLELTQNPPTGRELGVVIPANPEEGKFWFVIFEFDEVGYVKDEDKDKLDASALLKSLQEGTEESNKVRKERGWDPFHIVGWYKPPFYDGKTKNLTWAIRGRGDKAQDEETVNYSTRILGRRGTMNVDLVLGAGGVSATVPQFEEILGGFEYTQGQRYAEFRAGDKIAEYGLAALITGGAAAVALKSGLLQKFWKLIVLGFVALAGALKKGFIYLKRVISGKAAEESPAGE